MTETYNTNDLVQLIDYELTQYSNRTSSPGWTPWAIGLSFSAIAWKSIDLFLSHPIEAVFWHYLLLLMLLRTFALNARDILDVKAITDRSPVITHELKSKRDFPSKTILNAAIEIIPIFTISFSPVDYGKWFFWSIVVFYTVLFLIKSFSVIDLYRSKTHYISESSASTGLVLFAVITEIAVLTAVAIFVYHWWSTSQLLLDHTEHANSVKMAALVFGAVVLLGMLQTRHQEPKLVTELHRIRQQILIGNADSIDLHNLKLLTLGIRSDEYLQNMKSSYDKLHDSATLSLEEIEGWLSQLESWDKESIEDKPSRFLALISKANSKQLSLISIVSEYHNEYMRSVSIVNDLVIGGLDKDVSVLYFKSTLAAIESLLHSLKQCRSRIDHLENKLKIVESMQA